jgi:two-component system chemotaxis sensor kinase CheA
LTRLSLRADRGGTLAIDRDKYRRLFIDESREGLAAIGNELVELERAARGGLSTPEAAKNGFDVVFRHAHSLKGMGAAMGYARFAHLAHQLEDVADLGRQGRALSSEAWDLLLSGCDALERCVDDVAGGADDPDPGALVARVDAFLARVPRHVRAARLPKELHARDPVLNPAHGSAGDSRGAASGETA